MILFVLCINKEPKQKKKHNNNKKIRKRGLYCRQNDIQTIAFMQVQILIQINKAHYMHTELYNAHWVIKYLTNNKGFTTKHLNSNRTHAKLKIIYHNHAHNSSTITNRYLFYFKLQNNKKYNKCQIKLYDLNTKSYLMALALFRFCEISITQKSR